MQKDGRELKEHDPLNPTSEGEKVHFLGHATSPLP